MSVSLLIGATEPDPSQQSIDPYTPPPQPEGEINPDVPNDKHVDLSQSAPPSVDTGG